MKKRELQLLNARFTKILETMEFADRVEQGLKEINVTGELTLYDSPSYKSSIERIKFALVSQHNHTLEALRRGIREAISDVDNTYTFGSIIHSLPYDKEDDEPLPF